MVDARQSGSASRANLRCAVYTRKSSEEGLEQEFNSLDAQREACEAYVVSQKHEGWTALAARYDDGAYSGGAMERPALQRLLEDIRARKIDVVVVYKVDRLTRSLADFAKIVEVFDAQGVSFVSITQSFNTTSSMGRLTLNVLLSFAQFEREVTGERIRHKIAASKKKGMWMGGQPALGYDVKERKLVVNEPEAAVRAIFRRYLELGSVRALRDDLAARGVVSKRRVAADGSPYGGQRFSRGALYLMLKNPLYRGQTVHKDKTFPGEPAAIVDEDLWAKVQSRLEEHRVERREGDAPIEPSVLTGLLFDADAEPMTPTHAVKKATRYRYYVSRRLITGTAAEASHGQRLPAANLETLIVDRLRALLADPVEVLNAISNDDRDAPLQKRLRDAAAALSARWEQLPTEALHGLTRAILARAQVHADRVDLAIGSGRLVRWLLDDGGNANRIFLTNPTLHTEIGEVPEHTLGLSISRSIDGGIHEDIDLVNHGMGKVQFNLEIAVRGDFADIFEVKSGDIVRGRITTAWSQSAARLTIAYINKDFDRRVTVTAHKWDSKPVYANGRISFELELNPGEAWHACLLYAIGDGKSIDHAPAHCIAQTIGAGAHRKLSQWQEAALKIETSNEEFYRFYHQSLEDMAALRLPIEGNNHLEFVPAAGVPWFLALFGRDSLTVSLQNAMVHPGFARGALEVLSRYQAKRREDYRDAEPGKIMHELRRGELAHFKLIPHTPYYGTADATILYLIVLHNAWRCTGDPDLLTRYMPVAEKCLTWIDKYGDRDGDGFQEYQTRSKAGAYNQGWKDSGQALVNTDGSIVTTPIALVEIQGYVYDAWLRMAQIYDVLGKSARAQTLREKAEALFVRFDDTFWDEESGFYAFCLDGDKKQVLSVASNPGQCLWSGIVPPDRAAKVVKRLMEPDMWSGWGIRTLSTGNPSYNPNSYQNGAVWPHDNGIIAMGFRRYGFTDEAACIARDISGAAGYFVQHQMPELYSGMQRDPTDFPVQYLGANVPQAWAAGSCFAMLQMIVGFQPDAPAGKLYIDPVLPEWLPKLTIRDLQVGENIFDLRFWRDDEATRFETLRGDPEAVVQKSYATAATRWLQGTTK